jgi:hypothetical protein
MASRGRRQQSDNALKAREERGPAKAHCRLLCRLAEPVPRAWICRQHCHGQKRASRHARLETSDSCAHRRRCCFAARGKTGNIGGFPPGENFAIRRTLDDAEAIRLTHDDLLRCVIKLKQLSAKNAFGVGAAARHGKDRVPRPLAWFERTHLHNSAKLGSRRVPPPARSLHG